MARFHAISFGEVLFDVFDSGMHLGGAPLNLAVHLHRMGAQTTLVSAVGQDELGDVAIGAIGQQGLSTGFIAQVSHPTGRVLIKLDQNKIPEYNFDRDCAYDHIPKVDNLSLDNGLFCFGSLAQRSAESRQTLFDLLDRSSMRVFFDANLRQDFYSKEIISQSLLRANILKINEDELPVLCQMFDLTSDISALATLATTFELQTVILTLGEHGCVVWHNGEFFRRTAHPARVISTVGAGDAFSAAFLYGLLNHGDITQAMAVGSIMAAKIAEQPGAF